VKLKCIAPKRLIAKSIETKRLSPIFKQLARIITNNPIEFSEPLCSYGVLGRDEEILLLARFFFGFNCPQEDLINLVTFGALVEMVTYLR
jgi:hypothetical protein